MELAEVERALRRPGEYFFEDGLWEMVVGLWILLAVGVPLSLGGEWAEWSGVLMLLSSMGLRPLVQVAKERWVHPRTGSVTYADVPGARSASLSLGLSPGADDASPDVPSRRAAVKPILIGLLAATTAATVPLSMRAAREAGVHASVAGHLAFSLVLFGCLLYVSARFRLRRWLVLSGVMLAIGALVASSPLPEPRALAAHAVGTAAAFMVSGGVAFARYRRRTKEPLGGPDGE